MFRSILAAALVLFLPLAAAAQTPPPSEAEAPPPRLRQRDYSETAITSRAGLEYRILVSVPRGPAPDGGFPVFYILDGDAFFNTAVEIARMREWGRLPPSIIVGVGYPSRGFYDGPRRNMDFTPPAFSDPTFDPAEVGGAERFLAFLTGELKPWVASRYAVDPHHQILFGHSLGGLFTLHALYTAPQSFNVYIAASPSIRLSDRLIVREAAAFAAQPQEQSDAVRALITVGALESGRNEDQIDDYRRWFTAHPEATGGQDVEAALREMFPAEHFDKVGETRRLARRLERSGVDVQFLAFEVDEHLPAGVDALLHGIPFALRPSRR
ncbi:alpha/beta hydrolase [Terricaulis sp.]|uniref:alpha/beta hydrolase n=1 Tax=Terricaulis sp. TaxID=2768686 RepID=UPI0037847BFE